MKKEKEEKEDVRYELYLTGGDRIILEDSDVDMDSIDFILEQIKEAWENGEIFCPEVACGIYATLNGNPVDEIDMRRVIALKWD